MQDADRLYDELLLTHARSGNRRAAKRLAERWQPRLLATARRLLQEDDLAREAVQETWLAVCRGWLTLRDPAKFPSWTYGILNRKAADVIRRRQHQRTIRSDDSDPNETGAADGTETRISLDQALSELSNDHRLAAILFFGEGLTLAEIAQALNVPQGTIKSRIHYARKHLRAQLGDNTS